MISNLLRLIACIALLSQCFAFPSFAQEQPTRIRSKIEQVRQGVAKWRAEGRNPQPLFELTKDTEALVKAGRADEAERRIDQALELINSRTSGQPEIRVEAIPKLPLVRTVPKLALIPAAPDGMVPGGFELARKNGAELLYWYASWKDAVENSRGFDQAMKGLSQGRFAIVFNLIQIHVLGKYPNGYTKFTDRGFAEAFANFALEFSQKYKPAYIFIGNEVNEYFKSHKREVDAYAEVVSRTADKLRDAKVGTKVGVVFSFRDVKENDKEDLVETITKDADLIGYTVYGYREPHFQFIDPEEGIEMLEDAGDFISDKPFAIVETGWNTSPLLGSSEEEQSKFVEALFKHLPNSKAEFVSWFLLQDGKDCTNRAKQMVHFGANVTSLQFNRFKAFLCNFGLLRSNGEPKLAWEEWQEAIRN
jgi:hypothetical protein